ncbi:TIR domain-containing protein [Asanoa sp. NPDC049573]|uniref:TIR domain-containing protein n=1 Tax=Asanoa sp. NPDC049573 TaxID=3155396 RepID=UPI00342504DA
MDLFLSYAKEDQEVANKISKQLTARGLSVYDWLDNKQRGGRIVERMEEAISAARGFLALVSPAYAASPWCQRERRLAIHIESDRQSVDSHSQFVHVLTVARTDRGTVGFLRDYDWQDATNDAAISSSLETVVRQVRGDGTTPGGTPSPPVSSVRPPLFRNRETELLDLERALNNPGGIHFWLITAPPALGKSWLLSRLSTSLANDEDGNGWGTQLIDIREEPSSIRHDVPRLLARLFGLDRPDLSEPDAIRASAQRILASGRPFLCLLDSAELLDLPAIKALRRCMRAVYQRVQEAGDSRVRLGIVVASRRDDGWPGLESEPRLESLRLTPFRLEIVHQALADLARRMNRTNVPSSVISAHARRVHRLSEGLPALLDRALRWIQQEQWIELERLDTQELFQELAEPYIRSELLSEESLFPQGGDHLHETRVALETALRNLVPYRLITMSHVQYHLASDPELRRVASEAGLELETLWRALSRTALLLQLQSEPWHEVYAPIRRLLFRYFYSTDEARLAARRLSYQFVTIWTEKVNNSDQVRGAMECLWHEAVLLQLEDPASMAQQLPESMRALYDAFQSSDNAWELRSFAMRLAENDTELHAAIGGESELFDRLIGIINPGVGR